jgi:hypothetical protein
MTSPDFGLVVLGLCAPSIAFYPEIEDFFSFIDLKNQTHKRNVDREGRPPIILALLPWLLLCAQWGLVWSVFWQSVQDCKCCQIIHHAMTTPFVLTYS